LGLLDENGENAWGNGVFVALSYVVTESSSSFVQFIDKFKLVCCDITFMAPYSLNTYHSLHL
jgi:hypothetical protein